uniref:DUF3530 family protein n=1 Tax=Marinobacterium profundum TaxID=1714300 RepID=UPI00082988D6|nr:DUF3530 family protein [Marinobacterium profundum]
MKPILCALTLSFLLPTTLVQAAASAADTSLESSSPVALRERVEPAPQQQGMIDLARALAQAPETEVNWLETNNDRSLTLYQPASEAEPTGAVILLPDEHSHPDWPQDLHPLRTGLAHHGWDTLSVALPHNTATDVPARSFTSDINADPDNTDQANPQNATDATTQDTEITPMALYAERVIKICEAAIRHLESRQRDYLIFLGTGTGATWAALCTREFQQNHLLGLTLLNARQPATAGAPQLKQLLTELSVPVLDIYQMGYMANEAARLRANSARRALLESYHQGTLPEILPADDGALLVREVRGRIKRYLMPVPMIKQDAEPAEQRPGS